MAKTLTKKVRATCEALMAFIDASPTPFHAVQTMTQSLNQAGFEALQENEEWVLQSGGRYYVIREDSSLAAWIVGKEAQALSGMRIIGGHTDSPNLRIKPNPDLEKVGYQQLGVEVYGGVLLSSWADRDLSLAGRVLVADAQNQGVTKHFIRLERPMLRIPLLAIHLNREVNTQGLILNPQTHLAPVWSLQSGEDGLRKFLSKELATRPQQIVGYDLSLYDVQKSSWMGLHEEFLVAPRLDNLFSCFCGLNALLAIPKNAPPPQTCLLVAFDHEEIGSLTLQGARSSFLKSTLQRIISAVAPGPQTYERSVAASVFLSADMAHAVHPNYSDRHDPKHLPHMNQGPVLKINAQGRYTTSGASMADFELVCRRRNIPTQKFVNRTDLACGSTIGPFVASELGMVALDVGAAQLSMHSIREMCGSLDAHYMIDAFEGFFKDS